jgi:hypothetical protein
MTRYISPEEARLMLQSASMNDGRSKLVFDGGWKHVKCGGPAEVARSPNLMANCLRCGHVVPSREVERA